ncbi:hypothetical protein CCYA_CCYA14G3768 [Cyanidiococcus yangmingshanensis]|nr:hypothetical protein CCYA_CCYA14G3768 [Cyanidiococcus yangmingshanensis]
MLDWTWSFVSVPFYRELVFIKEQSHRLSRTKHIPSDRVSGAVPQQWLRAQQQTEKSRGPSMRPWPVLRFIKDASFFLNPFRGSESRPNPIERLRKSREAPQAEGERATRGPVLVAGATGLLGRRVVAQLLESGYTVRALVRSEKRAEQAFNDLEYSRCTFGEGTLDANAPLQLLFGDLYNIPAAGVQDITAVVCCTGVKVGPEEDTPDRDKYGQGIKFYEPVILEDTPANVEYRGIQNLLACTREPLLAPQVTVLFDFEDSDQARLQWGPVDDVVMGGVSSSALSFPSRGVGRFTGTVSTENFGGFASVRTLPFRAPLNLQGYDGFELLVRGDGKRYKFIVRCDDRWDGIAYACSFDTKDSRATTAWQRVRLPFERFVAVFRGSTRPNERPMDIARMQAFQIMLSKFEYDGELNPQFSAGEFFLELRSIGAYRDGADTGSKPSQAAATTEVRTSKTPRYIHISSAGVTRVLRPNEFKDLSLEPPAVRMNAQLGRIMEWKLAGEDLVRSSGVPYTIIRPCALTLAASRGLTALHLDQGDTLRGQIARDDLAALVVACLQEPAVEGKTFEVATSPETERPSTVSLHERALQLQRDQDATARTFAPFPYVPQ